ncbi:hypothetical protein LUZ62_031291 [Rhynchospora pubera]|nr:hypothetical protein LUZ62_076377 [Rhynchospora pubera]KAJ4818725.1 hypothetical protein LUZ62_031291 [Rhynchospora pubera]
MTTTRQKTRGIKSKRIAITIPLLRPQEMGPRRRRLSGGNETELILNGKSINSGNPFDALSDDVLISVLCKVAASATSPSDLINVMSISKRFSVLGVDQQVLAKASGKAMCVRAKNWSDSSEKFLRRCADAGNLEACYFLGMIHFHCLRNYASGTALLERAAEGSHSAALYSLAIIRFNKCADVDGGSSCQHDLNSAASLCVRSATLGNVDALREVGYCLQHGVGLPPSPTAAYHLLHKANTLKLITGPSSPTPLISPRRRSRDISLLTNYGYMGREVHAANIFMVEWWWLGDKGEDGLHMCSNVVCGRRETRKNGFRRCSRCGTTMYCSHVCQEMHWNMEHGATCTPVQNA